MVILIIYSNLNEWWIQTGYSCCTDGILMVILIILVDTNEILRLYQF